MEIILQNSKLRKWKHEDAASLALHANNKKIADNLRDAFPHPYKIEDAKKWLEMALDNNENLMLAIEVDGNAVGGVGIHQFSDVYRKTAEIGYWLSEQYWNRGIVTEAIKAISEHAFANYDIVRLQAGVFHYNEASKKVLTKCGFTLEAIHKKAVIKNNILLDECIFVKFNINK